MQEASRIPSLISVFNWNHQERFHKGFLLFSIKLGFLPMPEVNDKTGSEQVSEWETQLEKIYCSSQQRNSAKSL